MTDLQAKAEAAADAVREARAYLGQLKKAEAHAAFGSASTSVRVKDAPELIRIMSELIKVAAFQSEGWRPGDKAICTIDGHEHEVTILGKHETHWRIDFGSFESHAPEHRLRLPAPPEGDW